MHLSYDSVSQPYLFSVCVVFSFSFFWAAKVTLFMQFLAKNPQFSKNAPVQKNRRMNLYSQSFPLAVWAHCMEYHAHVS